MLAKGQAENGHAGSIVRSHIVENPGLLVEMRWDGTSLWRIDVERSGKGSEEGDRGRLKSGANVGTLTNDSVVIKPELAPSCEFGRLWIQEGGGKWS